MTGKDWQVTFDFKTGNDFDDDAAFDLIEEFSSYGASAALNPDGKGGSLTVTVTADSGVDALTLVLGMAADSKTLHSAEIAGFEVIDWDEARQRIREPLFPAVVGYAEIARMTNVSRQRAAMFPKIDSFPKPVIETAQGPLYSKAAVAAWAANRTTKAGRPKTA